MNKPTPKKILAEVAEKKWIFVHRYKWSHEKRREICRKLFREGLLDLAATPPDGFIYTVTARTAAPQNP